MKYCVSLHYADVSDKRGFISCVLVFLAITTSLYEMYNVFCDVQIRSDMTYSPFSTIATFTSTDNKHTLVLNTHILYQVGINVEHTQYIDNLGFKKTTYAFIR